MENNNTADFMECFRDKAVHLIEAILDLNGTLRHMSADAIRKILQLKVECWNEAIDYIIWIRQIFPEYKLVIGDVYRNPQKQDQLYREGSHRTTLKGGQSKHQQRKAMDLYFVKGNKILPFEKAPYKEIGQEWVKRGHIWGGNWKVPFDPGHFEWD